MDRSVTYILLKNKGIVHYVSNVKKSIRSGYKFIKASEKTAISNFKQKHTRISRWIDGAKYKERKDNQEVRRGRDTEGGPGQGRYKVEFWTS